MAVTKFPGGVDTQLRDSNRTERKTGTYTVVSNTDAGKTFVSSAATTYTLHATSVGSVYKFVYDGPDGGASIRVDPAAADGINGFGTATVVNKDVIHTTATSRKGDYITIASLAGATGVTAWCVIDQRGIWAKEA